jgi:hypothetical protein
MAQSPLASSRAEVSASSTLKPLHVVSAWATIWADGAMMQL